MSNPFDLHGRTAIVTGASTGLGRALAIGLARAGAGVAAVDIVDCGETVAAVEGGGGRCLGVRADLSDIAGHAALLEQVTGHFGDIHILVNNAGIIRRADALEFSEQDWDDVLNINLKAVFFLSQAAAREMVARGHGGKIINIASMLSFQGGIRVVSYTASKSGVAGITRLLANEWAARGINVNAIAPGYMATNNTKALREDPVRNREILGRIPAGRWGEPDDLQGAAVFLASPASDYVQGAILPVDGGWLTR